MAQPKNPSFSVKLSANSTGFDLDLNKPTTALVLVIGLCGIVFPLVIALFSFLRPRLVRVYSPRLLLVEEKGCPLGKLPSSFFAWISPAYMLTDDDIFNHIGMDALVFMRIFRLCIKMSLFALPFGLILILPLNLHGENRLSDPLDRMSAANIKGDSAKLWAHWCCVWIYSAATMYLLYEEWKVYTVYRQAYLCKGTGKQYAALVHDLDKDKLSDESFREFADILFPEKVSGTYLIKDLVEWDSLIKKHDHLVRKLESAKAKSQLVVTEAHNLVDEKSGAVFKYEKKLQLLQTRIEQEQIAPQDPIPAAIVVFNSLNAQMISVHSPWDIKVFHNNVKPAPDPGEIIWSNLSLSPFQRRAKYTVGEALVLFIFLIWSPIVALISSLKNLQALAKQLHFLEGFVNALPPTVIAIFQGIVPASILAFSVQVIVPKIFNRISRFQGLFTTCDVERFVFRDLTHFNVFNTFFIFVVSSSFFGVVYNIFSVVESPSDIPLLLASSLPSQANFYINYIALLTFILYSLDLLRALALLKYAIKIKWCAKTQRSKLEAWRPGPPCFAESLTSAVLVFMVGMSYSVLSPLIVPFMLLYFVFGYVVWAYKLVHVYIADHDLGGELWPLAFSRLVGGIVVFQLLMVGSLILRGLFIAGALIVPLLIITCFYWYWVNKAFRPLGHIMARATALGIKESDDDFLKAILKSYIRNLVTPGVYSVSSDVKRSSFDYEYHVPPRCDSDQELATCSHNP